MSLLTAVNVEYLQDVWPWVRKGLEVVQRRGGGRWLPEDVYTALRNAQAATHLFVIGQDDGFIVVQRQVQPSGPVMHIWAIYGNLVHLEDQLYTELDMLAAAMGARTITWHSKRNWSGRGYGKPVMTIYEHEVAYGQRIKSNCKPD